METVLKVEGMSCGHCVSAVTDILNDIEGVRSVNVSLETSSATIIGEVEKSDLINALSDTPYKGL